jgi:hypothetical protein
MHNLDATDVENLSGLWSSTYSSIHLCALSRWHQPADLFAFLAVFHKCAESMEDGKRLENMSWRMWSRQSTLCAPQRSVFSQRWNLVDRRTSEPASLPELSSSIDSDSSVDESNPAQSCKSSRPDIRRQEPLDNRSRSRSKHVAPITFDKIVISIKEKQQLEPLSPLPTQLTIQADAHELPTTRVEDTTPRPSSPPQIVPESSTSTVATALESETSGMSPPVGSDASTSTDLSSHSVVRGFSLGRVSSSLRAKAPIAAAQGLKAAPALLNKSDAQKKKVANFIVGSESDDHESSVDTHTNIQRTQSSIIAEGLKSKSMGRRKATKFELGSITRSDDDRSGSAIESEDEDPSESAIEEDDDDAWSSDDGSDDEDENGSGDFQPVFTRQDSRPNLAARRSLITTALTEQDRAKALQAEATRSRAPPMRRSRTSSPNGPSLATSPKEHTSVEVRGMQIPTRPAIMTTSNLHNPATSPRTTRRNMLSTELTESLRKHLLWERQQKNSTSNAALKRRHTSNDMRNLRQYPGESRDTARLATIGEAAKGNNSWNAYFDHGLGEYHVKGW